MKNETYIKNEITKLMVLPSGLGFTKYDIKEATQVVLSLIDKAIEEGSIKYVDKKILDKAIYKVLDTYF